MSRGVWKPVSRKKVVEEMKRKLITTKWIFKKKTEQDNSIRHKQEQYQEALCKFQELITQSLLHQ